MLKAFDMEEDMVLETSGEDGSGGAPAAQETVVALLEFAKVFGQTALLLHRGLQAAVMEATKTEREHRRGRLLTAYRSRRSWRASDARGLRSLGARATRLRELAQRRRRFGYRRLHIRLLGEGVTINRKKTQRLYTEEGLAVRRRKSRRRAAGARAPLPVVARANERWSLDFVHDQLVGGRRFRVLNVMDNVTRECLAAIVHTSISGVRVAVAT